MAVHVVAAEPVGDRRLRRDRDQRRVRVDGAGRGVEAGIGDAPHADLAGVVGDVAHQPADRVVGVARLVDVRRPALGVQVRPHVDVGALGHVGAAHVLVHEDEAVVLVELGRADAVRIAIEPVRRHAVRRARHQDRVALAVAGVVRHVHRREQPHAVAHRDAVLELGVVRSDVLVADRIRLAAVGRRARGRRGAAAATCCTCTAAGWTITVTASSPQRQPSATVRQTAARRARTRHCTVLGTATPGGRAAELQLRPEATAGQPTRAGLATRTVARTAGFSAVQGGRRRAGDAGSGQLAGRRGERAQAHRLGGAVLARQRPLGLDDARLEPAGPAVERGPPALRVTGGAAAPTAPARRRTQLGVDQDRQDRQRPTRPRPARARPAPGSGAARASARPGARAPRAARSSRRSGPVARSAAAIGSCRLACSRRPVSPVSRMCRIPPM